MFDTAGVSPTTINFDTLPSKDLSTAKTGDLFAVQVRVSYTSVALPPYWFNGQNITGMALVRHE